MTNGIVSETTPLSRENETANTIGSSIKGDRVHSQKQRSIFVRILLGDIPVLFRFPPIFTFIASTVLMITAGLVYGFSMLSPQLQDIMKFSIIETSMIGTFLTQGFYLSVPYAFLNDIYGPRMSILIAMIFGTFSTFSMWVLMAFFPGKVPAFVFMILFLFLGAGGTCQFNASLSTNIRNFPAKYRGIVVGFFASLFGLSAFVYSFIYRYIFNLNLTHFMFFLTIMLLVVCTTSLIFVNEVPLKETMSTVVEHEEVDSEYGNSAQESQIEEEPFEKLVNREESLPNYYRLGINYTPLQVLRSVDYWIAAIMMFFGIGCGLCIMINLGQIVRAVSGPSQNQKETDAYIATLVSIVSVSNCIGRLLFGSLSDLTSTYLSRPFWFMVAVGTMGIVHITFAFAPLDLYPVACVLFGISYGAHFSIAPSFISERFGSKLYTINYSFLLIIGPSFGSLIIATLLPSFLYNRAAKGKRACYGPDCYQYTFYITTIFCILGCFLGYILMIRNRLRYIYAAKLQKKKPSILSKVYRMTREFIQQKH